jgi:hypothetical protein
MAERAAHLVDHVFPPVAVRQWVLSLPGGARPLAPAHRGVGTRAAAPGGTERAGPCEPPHDAGEGSAPAKRPPDDARAAAEFTGADLKVRARQGGEQLWADLMRRTFGFDVLECPRCGARMRLVGTIEQRAVIDRILRHLGLPTEVPSPWPARAPPLDQYSVDVGADLPIYDTCA